MSATIETVPKRNASHHRRQDETKHGLVHYSCMTRFEIPLDGHTTIASNDWKCCAFVASSGVLFDTLLAIFYIFGTPQSSGH